MTENKLDIEIGERLREIIQALKRQDVSGKMNSREFANAIEIDESQFSRIKNGESGLSKESILDISSKFNISTEWILTGRGGMFLPNSKPEQDLEHQIAIKDSEIESLRSNLDAISAIFSRVFGSGKDKNQGLGEAPDFGGRKEPRRSVGKNNKQKDISLQKRK